MRARTLDGEVCRLDGLCCPTNKATCDRKLPVLLPLVLLGVNGAVTKPSLAVAAYCDALDLALSLDRAAEYPFDDVLVDSAVEVDVSYICGGGEVVPKEPEPEDELPTGPEEL